MKKICICTLLLLLFLSTALVPYSNANADSFNIMFDGNTPIIDDKAGILTDYDEVLILNAAKEQRDSDGFQYILLTTDDTSSYSISHELEQIYDDCHEDVNANGTVLFIISTDEKNRFCEVQGYGDAAKFIPHDICSKINNDVKEYFDNDNYIEMFNTLFKDFSLVKTGEIVSSENDANPKSGYASVRDLLLSHISQTILILFLSIIVSCFITLSLIRTYNSKNFEHNKCIIKKRQLAKQDIYIRTTTSIQK